MKITSLDKVEQIKMNMEGVKDVYKQVPISKNDGSPAYSFRVFTIEPGGHTPYHSHAFEHINYIIGGKGALVTESGDERPVSKGNFCLILPGETHQFRNKSDREPLIFICAVPKEYE
jgi:quercetin dioxygenase-like cupin family protein